MAIITAGQHPIRLSFHGKQQLIAHWPLLRHNEQENALGRSIATHEVALPMKGSGAVLG
ncbi:hypothetical protein [Janthinobacterium sp. CAN_S7]|uniref:hypothetical protein n=1 Tax=Janthinobacterium sp. CAN_S7 TaxID=3071704 RepID=UPI00319DA480